MNLEVIKTLFAFRITVLFSSDEVHKIETMYNGYIALIVNWIH